MKKQAEEVLLVDAVRHALSQAGNGCYSEFVIAGNRNFAGIRRDAGMAMVSFMKPEPTSSHRRAWQLRLQGHFALKVYETAVDLWDVAVVTTGWRHYVDAAIYHSRVLPQRNYINYLNARHYLASQATTK